MTAGGVGNPGDLAPPTEAMGTRVGPAEATSPVTHLPRRGPDETLDDYIDRLREIHEAKRIKEISRPTGRLRRIGRWLGERLTPLEDFIQRG